MEIITEGPYSVTGNRDGINRSCFYHFPSIEKLSNGEIILCCKELHGSMNDPKGRILMFRSSDEGKTWEKGISPTCNDENAYPEKGYLMAHITELGPAELISVYSVIDTDRGRPLFNPETDGMQNAVTRITRSFDNGRTWIEPVDIEFKSTDIIVPGKIIKLSDGSIGFPCEMHDHWEGGYMEGSCSRFIKSYDHGLTFPEGSVIASADGILYGDARPVFINEEVLIFFWTLDLKNMKDLPVHFVSTLDNGKTWSDPSPVNITTQIMSPVYFHDKLMLAVHQDRFSSKPGLKALVSYDNGLTWDRSSEITLFSAGNRPDGTNPFAQFSQFQFGYSSILKTGENSCLVSFWHVNGSATSISIIKITIKDK